MSNTDEKIYTFSCGRARAIPSDEDGPVVNGKVQAPQNTQHSRHERERESRVIKGLWK